MDDPSAEPTAADPVAIQRAYYRATAEDYLHTREEDLKVGRSDVAVQWLLTELTRMQATSLLDVGSGTGKVLLAARAAHPDLVALGIEPSAEMRQQGHAAGLPEDVLVDGDANHLAFPDGSFDVVCEFGALHHMPHPRQAVNEMLRVAAKAVFFFDVNNFGGGSRRARMVKQTLDALGLWRYADLVKTRGKGYRISAGDGLSYSYSLFNDFPVVRAACSKVHLMATSDTGANPYRSATHVAVLGFK